MSSEWRLALGVSAAAAFAFAVIAMLPGTLPFPPGEPFSDAAISHWPNAAFLRQSMWQHGQWPLWHPGRMLGYPFAANPLSKVWYPPQWTVLVLPPTLHLNLMVYAHMVALAVGSLLWLRAEGLQPQPALFGALAFTLTPRLPGHLALGHLDIIYAAAWAPWLMLAVRSAAVEPSLRRAVIVALVTAGLVLADVRIALYMLIAAGVYALIVREGPWRRVLPLAGAAVMLAAGLLAVQLVPLLALSDSLTRTLITPEDAAVLSLEPGALLGLFIPDPTGYGERMTHLGIPVIMLAVIALLPGERSRFRRLWPWLVVIGGALMWALGENGPVFLPALRALPFLTWFRVPSRAWFLVVIAVVLLSAHGVDRLMAGSVRAKPLLAALALGGLLWAGGLLLLIEEVPATAVWAGLVLSLSAAAIVVMDRGLARRLKIEDYRTLPLLAVLIGPLMLYGWSIVEGRPPEPPAALDLGPCEVVYDPGFELLQNPAQVRTLNGVDPFQLVWSAQAISAAAGVPYEGYSIPVPPLPGEGAESLQAVTPDDAALAALGVTRIFGQRELAGLPVSGCAITPNRTRFEAGGPLPMAYAPGWRTASGEPVGRQGMLIAEDGPIEIVYRPTADFVGMGITAVSLLGCAVVWWWGHDGHA